MKNSKDKLMQALSGLLPEDVRKEVSVAVKVFAEDMKAELDAEYNANLEQAYRQVAKEKSDVEKVAEQGYAEAYQIITDLRDRLEIQKEEFEQALEEGYEEAYQMLLSERNKNENLEVNLYDEYDNKLKEIKEYMVDKIDEFLSTKGEEFYEEARRDVLSDPTVVKHKVALDRILEAASGYISGEDITVSSKGKLEELSRQLESVKGQQRILEAKNIRLSTENSKLNEAVRHQQSLLTESVKYEQKERLKKARMVEGRGQKNVERPVVIGEHNENRTTTSENRRNNRVVEHTGSSITEQWKHLAGIPKK